MVQVNEEIGWNEEAAEGDAFKYYDLLKKAEKPLYGGTKHSKLSATIHLYNLKCIGGLSNTIFSALLEFIIQLLPTSDETLPVNTYEAKKLLKDIGLGYCNDPPPMTQYCPLLAPHIRLPRRSPILGLLSQRLA
jgi:hypothetical protein